MSSNDLPCSSSNFPPYAKVPNHLTRKLRVIERLGIGRAWCQWQEVGDEVINDFMYGYYGRSGQYIREYLDLLHSQVTPETHIHLGLEAADKIFSDQFVLEAEKVFDEAERVAENKTIKERVELVRLPLMYLKCKRYPVNSKSDGTYERFINIVEREGITHFAEAGKPHIDAFNDQVNNAE